MMGVVIINTIMQSVELFFLKLLIAVVTTLHAKPFLYENNGCLKLRCSCNHRMH